MNQQDPAYKEVAEALRKHGTGWVVSNVVRDAGHYRDPDMAKREAVSPEFAESEYSEPLERSINFAIKCWPAEAIDRYAREGEKILRMFDPVANERKLTFLDLANPLFREGVDALRTLADRLYAQEHGMVLLDGSTPIPERYQKAIETRTYKTLQPSKYIPTNGFPRLPDMRGLEE